MLKQSSGERAFLTHWLQYGLLEELDMPELTPEYRFRPPRKERFDFAHVASKTAIEVDGGVWTKRKLGHTSGKGYTEDREKDIAAIGLGWIVIRVTPQMVEVDPLRYILFIIEQIESRMEDDRQI